MTLVTFKLVSKNVSVCVVCACVCICVCVHAAAHVGVCMHACLFVHCVSVRFLGLKRASQAFISQCCDPVC